MEIGDLVAVIREFSGTMGQTYDLEELLHRLTQHATVLTRSVGAGIMLSDGSGELDFVAASEERVVEAELQQAKLRSGACFEAYSTNEIIVCDDLGAESRWPEYVGHVTDLGLRAVVGMPMNAYGRTIGALNLYRDEPATWTEEDIGAAEILVAMAAAYIAHADEGREQRTLTTQLRTALESRDLIGQAKGLLMARANVDADGAFTLLRDRSQATNRKLRELAQELVDRHASRGRDEGT